MTIGEARRRKQYQQELSRKEVEEMGWFTDFVGIVTGDSSSKVSSTHHQARDDSGVRDGKDKDYFKSAPEWADRTSVGGVDKFPEGK